MFQAYVRFLRGLGFYGQCSCNWGRSRHARPGTVLSCWQLTDKSQESSPQLVQCLLVKVWAVWKAVCTLGGGDMACY